jgi:hypothetical protein
MINAKTYLLHLADILFSPKIPSFSEGGVARSDGVVGFLMFLFYFCINGSYKIIIP